MGNKSEGWAMISIGAQYKGPELKGTSVFNAINFTMQIASKERETNYDDGQNAWINPIYLVPGSVSQPTFNGYDVGRFSKKEKALAIAIAAPQSVADGEGIAEFITESLREAVRLAAGFFADKAIVFSTLKAEKIIRAIELELLAFPKFK